MMQNNCKRTSGARMWLALDLVGSWSIAILLVASGSRHFSNPYYFLGSVYAYGIVGPGLGQIVAAAVPVLQLTLAVLLIAGIWRDAALHVALGMFAVFVLVQYSAWWRGLAIECGCLGPAYDNTTIGFGSIGMALLGLILAATSVFTGHVLRSRPHVTSELTMLG